MKLRDLQTAFQNHVLAGDPAIRARVAATTTGADPDTRLGIYTSAYRLRLLEALATDYPGLQALAGESGFDRLGRAYIDRHPSAQPSLRWYGGKLGEFLRHTPPWSGTPALAEMAAFEWALSDAFDAPDDTVLTVADMAAIPADAWPGLRFRVHPSVRRLDLQWNVPELWQAARDDKVAMPQAFPHPVGWLVWRRELETLFRSLAVEEAFALDALRTGRTFAEICETLTEWIDPSQVAGHAAGLLKRWIEDGVLAGTGP